MAGEFLESTKKSEVVNKAEALLAKELKGVQTAQWILANMKKIEQKGAAFLAEEKARLQGLVSNRATLPAKQVEFKRRIAALNVFQAESK